MDGRAGPASGTSAVTGVRQERTGIRRRGQGIAPTGRHRVRSAGLRMSRARGGAMLGGMMSYYRAWENRRFVQRLLREKQPELAAALESMVQEPPCPRCHGAQCSMPGRLTVAEATWRGSAVARYQRSGRCSRRAVTAC